jgi:hypothetical protein
LLNSVIGSELTNDFWEITVPKKLLISSSKRNSIRNAFFASLIRKGANVLFSDRKVGDLFDPAMKLRKKSLEKHHIFPKNYLIKKFNLEFRQVNQVANFTYLEYEDNIEISDKPPKTYYDDIKSQQYLNSEEELKKMLSDHCLPENFYEMNYDDFLIERRKLMANTIRTVFNSL